jgi:hypothetical protein
MKVIGIMCVKDEADLLPEVLDHLNGELDRLYAYDDGSIDDTQKILRSHPTVDYLMTKEADEGRLSIKRPHYHHLLEQIKLDHLGCGEPVWVVITMGDRFFINKMPRQIAEEAEAGGYNTVNGIQLDFMRPPEDPWNEENDTFPKYSKSLREICTWFTLDEECIVAFKLSPERTYLKARYPWPRGGDIKLQYDLRKSGELSMEVPFLEHQGRRSPNAFKWRVESGSRKLSEKIDLEELTFDEIQETLARWYDNWGSYNRLEDLIEDENELLRVRQRNAGPQD